ncbi:cupredoxin domain-containing protein [Embleya scabrispora]|uniref:cupredoxin domain-containing protein n=1 Tax=Embleya scabrispora TaxID=159449 RepID=UPI001FDFFB3F|nr:cupredoxin domain-containing protein [Embleya scabrispora]
MNSALIQGNRTHPGTGSGVNVAEQAFSASGIRQERMPSRTTGEPGALHLLVLRDFVLRDFGKARLVRSASSYRPRPTGPIVGALLLVFVLVCACGGSSGSGSSNKKSASPSASLTETADVSTITIQNFAFAPTMLTVKPGTTVTVVNQDSVAHTVTALKDQAFDTGTIDGGTTTTTFVAPNTPGTYDYQCTIHPFMKGTLVVK